MRVVVNVLDERYETALGTLEVVRGKADNEILIEHTREKDRTCFWSTRKHDEHGFCVIVTIMVRICEICSIDYM